MVEVFVGGWLNVRRLRRGLGDVEGGGGVRWWGFCWTLDTLRGYVRGRKYVGGGVSWGGRGFWWGC